MKIFTDFVFLHFLLQTFGICTMHVFEFPKYRKTKFHLLTYLLHFFSLTLFYAIEHLQLSKKNHYSPSLNRNHNSCRIYVSSRPTSNFSNIVTLLYFRNVCQHISIKSFSISFNASCLPPIIKSFLDVKNRQSEDYISAFYS